MKKLLTVVLLILVLITVMIYVLIPRTLKISATSLIGCNANAAFRIMSQPANWQKWGSGGNTANTTDTTTLSRSFVYNQDTFRIEEIIHNAVKISIKNGALATHSLVNIFSVSKDSFVVQWESLIHTGLNPFSKISCYMQAGAVKKNMKDIIKNMAGFLEKQENVYGSSFCVSSTTDTLLIARKSIHAMYPTTAEIYSSVNLLQQFALKKGAQQTALPMMNVTRLNENEFQLMVAIPVDKQLENEGTFFYRKMVPGNFLVTEVKGGTGSVKAALQMMGLYISDYGKTAMAIPFEKLITDRSIEPDSTQWLTKIYYPVIR